MKERPDIPIIFNDRVPQDFINDLNGWSLSKQEVESSKGKLLNLDVDLGTACSLDCPMCYRKDGMLSKQDNYMTYDRLIDTITEARELGLRSVRLLGAGEPFEYNRTVEFLCWLHDQGLNSIVFTQGHNIDKSLAQKIAETDTSILLRYDSFVAQTIELSTGTRGMKQKKDQALYNLVAQGLNRHNPTRLAIVAPITSYTADGILELYTFFRDRNIYPLIPFIACAGRSLRSDGSVKDDVDAETKIDIVTKLYEYNFSKGIEYDGVSSYPGSHICTFIPNGFYLTITGIALRCEGDDTSVIGDLKHQSITEIWKNSPNNKKFGGRYNYGCPPKVGRSIPNNLYAEVEKRLKLKGLLKS